MVSELDTYLDAPIHSNGDYTLNFINERLRDHNACFHESEDGSYSIIFDSEEDQIIFTIKYR